LFVNLCEPCLSSIEELNRQDLLVLFPHTLITGLEVGVRHLEVRSRIFVFGASPLADWADRSAGWEGWQRFGDEAEDMWLRYLYRGMTVFFRQRFDIEEHQLALAEGLL
jgi:hypothetical protein